MKKVLQVWVAVLFMAGLLAGSAAAGEVDILVDKLVEKGILSAADAKDILVDVKAEAQKEREMVVNETKAALKEDGALSLDLPEWVRKTQLTGDFRLRYQFTDRDRSAERHRGRYRLRLGLVSEINDQVTVGIGLATGGTDPRSTNQTMTNSFESPDFRLDYAYVAYEPFPWLTLTGGKFKNPLWTPSDLLWDGDIRPEGVSAQLNKKTDSAELFLNAGIWVLDERGGDENDPMMFVVQPGYKVSLGDSVYFKNALSWYEVTNVDGTTLDHSAGTNSVGGGGLLDHDYDAVAVSAELGLATHVDVIPFVALFGEYVNNISVSQKDEGYLAGIKFGCKKVKKAREWQVKALYRRLEQDAWLDVFPDSDAYGGDTGVKGYEFVFNYGLARNISLALDYYRMKRINGNSMDEDLFQADINIKF